VDVGFFCDFIERFVARRKFNAVVFLTREGVHYDSHPEISGPAAWSKADVRRVVETCRAHFIEPIPLVDSYGHADWLTLSHKDLWEDGDHLIACSSHPETFRILTDVYAELLEVFAPVRYFHLGLDEVWWRTLDVPPEQRCKLCADVPKWQLFADQVKRLHDWLQVRGVRAMMWSDVLLPSNGGRSGSRCLTFSARWAFCTRPRRRCSSRTPMAATSASTWPSG
jgi:N-acetyl-beta-hexosaminidase